MLDKRVIKTRSAIFNAVFDLATEKELKKITVLELCEKAGINKSTFYLHYSSIEECFQKCFDYIMGSVTDFCKTIKYEELIINPERIVNIILDEIEKDVNYIYKFKNSAIYPQSMKILKDNLINSIVETNNFDIKNNYKEIVTIIFLVGGCLDAFSRSLPEFNREILTEIVVEMIKRKQ